jgi:hypothetical protein
MEVNRMTKETAQFLLYILDGITLNVGAPDFDEVVSKVLAARAELTVILTAD